MSAHAPIAGSLLCAAAMLIAVRAGAQRGPIEPLPPSTAYVGLDPREIASTLERSGEVHRCVPATAALDVIIEIDVEIEPVGTVRRARVDADAEAVAACVQGVIMRTRFPRANAESRATLRIVIPPRRR